MNYSGVGGGVEGRVRIIGFDDNFVKFRGVDCVVNKYGVEVCGEVYFIK